MRLLGMGWKRISIARRPQLLPVWSANAWPARNAQSSITAPCRRGVDRSMWMMKASRRRKPCSLKTEFSRDISATSSPSRLMGMPDTGNGRRESYEHIPMPRMTNTYMLAGQDDPEDIIRSVKRGIYAVNFGGGQVDITNGKFVFSASEAYMIEDGQVTAR